MIDVLKDNQHSIIDTHQHFWDLNIREYDWMEKGSILDKNYLPSNLKLNIDMVGVNKVISVQAHHSLEETFWLLDLAEKHDFVAGVVGWVDLTSKDLNKILDKLQKNIFLIGIRHVWHDETKESWIVQESVLNGIKELANRGIPFDFLARPNHLPYIPTVFEKVPNLKGVLDHIGKPLIAKEIFDPWGKLISEISEIPNLYCKISGMVTEASKQWKISDFNKYIYHIIEEFGEDRVMFGSDWPVCLLAGEYKQVFELPLKVLEKDLTENSKRKFLSDNAKNFYSL